MRGWWVKHNYERRSVFRDIEEFCGWPTLMQLVEACETPLERAFIATLFLTGSRVSEALQLEGRHFEGVPEEGLIIVRGAPLLKRFKKISEDPDGSWETEAVEAYRRPFPILTAEPLAPYLMERLGQTRGGYLFPSPRRPGKPLSRFWAYKLAGRLQEATGVECWPHAFRSWRASQLVSDYDFEVLDLLDFFGWVKHDQAVGYARRGWRGLASRMRPVRYLPQAPFGR